MVRHKCPKCFLNLENTKEDIKKAKWIVFDTETNCLENKCEKCKNQNNPKLKLWCAKDNNGVEYHSFSKNKWYGLLNILLKVRRRVYLWGHNNNGFDIRFFWERFVFDKPNFRNTGKIVSYKNLVFLDLSNVYSLSLDKSPMSKEQKKIKNKSSELFSNELYHNEEEWDNNISFIEELLEHCENDVNIAWDLVNSLPSYKKGTKATLGLYMLRNKFLPYLEFKKAFPNFALHKFDAKREFVQKCYRGAYVINHNERVNKKCKPFRIDKIGAYASIMKEKYLPVGKGQWRRDKNNNLNLDNNIIYDGENGYLGFYEIKVIDLHLKSEYVDIPKILSEMNEFGVREPKCKIVDTHIYVTGAEFKQILKYHEGKYYITNSLVFRVKKGLFDNFVDYFEDIIVKEKEKKRYYDENELEVPREVVAKIMFAKYMRNSLYGKFGQRVYWPKWELKYVGPKVPKGKDKLEYFWSPKTHRYYKYELSKEKYRTYGFNYVPVAATISSYMRIELMEKAIKYKELLITADTDGMLLRFKPEGIDKELGSELGDWREEPNFGETSFTIMSNKFYVIEGEKSRKVKAKGVPIYYHPELTFKKQIITVKYFKKLSRGARIIHKVINIADPVNNPKYSLVKTKEHKEGVWKCRTNCYGFHEKYDDQGNIYNKILEFGDNNKYDTRNQTRARI